MRACIIFVRVLEFAFARVVFGLERVFGDVVVTIDGAVVFACANHVGVWFAAESDGGTCYIPTHGVEI